MPKTDSRALKVGRGRGAVFDIPLSNMAHDRGSLQEEAYLSDSSRYHASGRTDKRGELCF